MNAGQEAQLLAHAQACKANVVCIRTSNPGLPDAIGLFHKANIAVYGWRWPATKPPVDKITQLPIDDTVSHYFAPNEAHYVATQLIPKGLDGYIVDPESDVKGADNDWNDATFAPLAAQFCATIKNAAAAAGLTHFRFGVTSGCAYPDAAGKPNIPWAEFVAASNLLLPQTYWRWTNPKTNQVQPLHGGAPDAAITMGVTSWTRISAGKAIVPMTGELNLVTAAEIAAYGARMQALGHTELHFYADAPGIGGEVWQAIADL